MTKLTPLKAIRAYCLWCCNDSAPEVRKCPGELCPLHPLRFGKGARKLGLNPARVIRQKCLDCVVGEHKRVKECPFDGVEDELCPIHFYRMGKNPNRPGGTPPASARFKSSRGNVGVKATPTS